MAFVITLTAKTDHPHPHPHYWQNTQKTATESNQEREAPANRVFRRSHSECWTQIHCAWCVSNCRIRYSLSHLSHSVTQTGTRFIDFPTSQKQAFNDHCCTVVLTTVLKNIQGTAIKIQWPQGRKKKPQSIDKVSTGNSAASPSKFHYL